METFELRLTHGAEISVFEVWVVSVHVFVVAFCAVVEIGQPALMKTFSSNVHFSESCLSK